MTGYPEAVLARELEMCYAAIALVTDLDAGVDAGEGVKAVDVFAEFAEEHRAVQEAGARRRSVGSTAERTCTHCLPHTGVTLPFELP